MTETQASLSKKQTYLKAHIPIREEQECYWTSETARTRDSQPPACSFLYISLWGSMISPTLVLSLSGNPELFLNPSLTIRERLAPSPHFQLQNAQGMIQLLWQGRGAYSHPWILGAFLRRPDIIEGSSVTLIHIYHDMGQWASFLTSLSLGFFVIKWKVQGGGKNNTLFKELLILHRQAMLMAGAMSGIYEASINVHFSFKVSLKVKEEVSTLKWRGKFFGAQGTKWEMLYNSK